MRSVLALTIAVVLFASCGSDEGASTDDVERSLEAVASTLSESGGRPLDLSSEPPKAIDCNEAEEGDDLWDCTVTYETGKNVLCTVTADPETGSVRRTSCAPTDY
jgi:hypothetical protein